MKQHSGRITNVTLHNKENMSVDPELRVRFRALPDILRSSGSGTGSTQPREYNWEATWKNK
jgi:hypothetical protein